MKPVTIVTAYFNIGRNEFKAVPRSEDTYYRQFKHWARMRNHLVVYTEASAEGKICRIREEFGLKDRTTVVLVDDLYGVEPEILEEMRSIAQDPFFQDFRLMPNATSGIANYSYLMLLKTWFVADAVQRGLAQETVAWLDFGFNHGGLVYPNIDEFDFEWSSDRLERVLLFMVDEYDDRPVFEIVRRLSDCIMGTPMLIPANRAGDLWRVNREAMVTLNRVGLFDDDQLVQLLSQRMRPDLFELRRSEWFRPLKDVAAPHLTIRDPQRRPAPVEVIRRLVHRWRRHRLAWRTSTRLYRNLMRGRP